MRNFVTIVILLVVLYSLFQDKKKILNNLFESDEPKKNELIDKNPSEKLAKKSHQYEYEPKGTVERVITNAVSDFVQTPMGKDLAKSMITPTDYDLKGESVAFSTKGFNALKRKYDLQTIITSRSKKTICGQKVKVHYVISDSKTLEIDSKIDEYIVGKHPIEELNVIVNGLYANEVVTGKYISFGKTNKNPLNSAYKITLGVLEHLTQSDFEIEKIKIYDDYITTARPIICGDDVKFHYKISKIDGSTIKEGDLEFNVGDYHFPEVLTYMLDTMPLIGTRTIIMPQKYLSQSDSHKILSSVSDDYVIVELNSAMLLPKTQPVAQ